SWLPVTTQIYWSAALHTWLLGYGGYLLMRRWRYGGIAAFVTGLVLAGSGFNGGLIGHINQMNGAAWLPWAVLVLERASDAAHVEAEKRALPCRAGRPLPGWDRAASWPTRCFLHCWPR
ncbi:MAG: hypothetical protein HC802_10180, partial [Caldilineaceae bacterium]|nr:hypothetical protein [Caldilineaceae bacterium]